MTDQVREIGQLRDVHDRLLVVSVDHDGVVIGNGTVSFVMQLGTAQLDDFSRLYFQAVTAAEGNVGKECTGACCWEARNG
jgi:hypothetical protein